MNGVVDSGSMQYAVIAGLHTETGIERLVIAYPSEESLRDLIAAPSIIAAGFSSPEEAAAGSIACAATVVGQQRITCRESEVCRREPGLAELPKDQGSVFRKLARFIVTSYGDVAASAFVILASRNAVSAVLRMALGSSV